MVKVKHVVKYDNRVFVYDSLLEAFKTYKLCKKHCLEHYCYISKMYSIPNYLVKDIVKMEILYWYIPDKQRKHARSFESYIGCDKYMFDNEDVSY